MDKLMETKNVLPEGARVVVAEALEQLVYDTVDFWSQMKTAHWNLRGPRFLELHQFFDLLAQRLEKAADKISERAVQLGCHAQGTVRESAKCSRMPDFGQKLYDEKAAVPGLIRRYGIYTEWLKQATEVAFKEGDQVTANMLITMMEKFDKDLWMLEALSR